ncbi:DUF2637 domain-containing protein [Nonomuraea sp. LPB2021202275-12-8]|uniref:DUF2637 domain-containing protein n=1 Tax=Nonomuraea sp. LPB2021202275-12-8 TaxID=3120159 RepID=UPI00300D284C
MIRFLTAAVVILLAGVAAVVSYRHAYEVVIANGESGFTAVLVPLTIDGLIFASSMVLLDAARRRLPAPKLAYFTLGLGILATLAANVMHGWAHGPVGAIVAAWPAVALVLSYELLMGLIRRSTVTDVTVQAAVPATVGVSPTVQPESVTGDTLERVEVTPSVVPVPVATAAVPAAFAGVPPQVAPSPVEADRHHGGDLTDRDVDDQVQPEPAHDPDAPYYPLALNHFLSDVVQGATPPVRAIKDGLNVGTDRARRLKSYLGKLVEVAQ